MEEKMFTLGDPIQYWKMLELNENYKKEKKVKLDEHIKKEETNAIWFEKNDSLIAFLSKILSDSGITGLRVYLCDYGKKVKDGIPKDTRYLNQLTVSFVPTVLDGGQHRDLPAVDTDLESTFVLTGAAYNNGSLCPPEGGCN